MAVCQYFLRGQCRFGDGCRNDHPANPRSGFGNQSWTNNNPQANKPNLPFTQESMKNDLSTEKPIWPLSSYGPAKQEPNLISGIDESMEELRVRAVFALRAGNSEEYATYESGKTQAADQAFANARNHLSSAYQTAANQSPHADKQSTPTTSAFGSTTATSAFGQTGFGSSSNTQQTSAFGQPASAPQSAFGQPSSTPQSAFGKASTAGGATFGQSSFAQPQSAFSHTSQPSSFIKPASGAFSAFANTSSSPFAAASAATNQNTASGSGSGSGGGFSAFAGGQPTAFGTSAQNTNPSSSNTGSVFGGGGSNTATTNGFGAPAPVFGQPSQPQQQNQSAFGALQSQPTSVFGQPSQQPQSAFGAPQSQSAFGVPQPAQTQSAFGTVQNQPQSVFGSGGGGTNPKPLTAQTTAPSSIFTPLSSSSNPLNAGGQQQQVPAPAPFGSTNPNPNPLGSAPHATPFSAFTSGPTPSNPLTNPSNNNSNMGSDNTFTGGTTTTTTMTTANPLTNPSTKPNFTSLLSKIKAQPGITPYDSLLPPQYGSLLPENVVNAFKGEKFDFGKVPEWVPPVELR